MLRHKSPGAYAWAAVLLVAALVLTACPQPTPVTEEIVVEKTVVVEKEIQVEVEKTVIVEKEVVVTPTPPPLPKGGIVTEVSFSDAKILNPILSNDNASSTVHELMFEGLVDRDPQTGAIIPELAESWETSEDGLSLTFHLRDGVQWSDRTPLTSADVKFTYEAIASDLVESPRKDTVALVESIDTPDEKTVVFNFSAVDCPALTNLTLGIMPGHLYADDFSDVMTSPENTAPTVVSGPFKFQEWVKDDHITLVRNDNYWDGAPLLDGWIYRVVGDSVAAVAQMQTGEADVYRDVDVQFITTMEIEPTIETYKAFDDGYDYMAMNLANPDNPQLGQDEEGNILPNDPHPILGDNLVRQAIVYAIDRPTIISRVYLGQGVQQEANVLPAIEWAFDDTLPARPFDPAKAAAMLDEAGWLLNETTGIREKDGVPLKLRLATNAGNTQREDMAVLVQSMLKDVGIEVEFEAMEWNSFLGMLVGQTFDMVIVGWTNTGIDPDDRSLWHTANDQPDAGFNFVSMSNPELDKLLDDARTLPGCSTDERGALYKQIQSIIYDEVPYVFLQVPLETLAYNNRIVGMDPGPWEYNWNIQHWYIAQ